MRTVKIIILSSALVGIFLTSGCELPWDPGPQASYIDQQKFQPKLNVLGIIRPGQIAGHPLSFVHLEMTHDFKSYPDSLEITDADVQIFQIQQDSTIRTFHLYYTYLFATSEYYSGQLDTEAAILAGQTFALSCKRDGYPELTARTTIPSVPVIMDNNITIENNEIGFVIQRDDSVGLYDIYLQIDTSQYYQRLLAAEVGNTAVKIKFANPIAYSGRLTLYAYDLKLSQYITYKVIIKPQTYQSMYSTVENGYGCFGSINILEKIITF